MMGLTSKDCPETWKVCSSEGSQKEKPDQIDQVALLRAPFDRYVVNDYQPEGT